MYDVIIIGAGPAGLSAGLYCGRSRLNTLIIEKASDGGQIAITDEIENYPGGLSNEESTESGSDLIARMTRQVAQFGAERVSATVTKVELEDKIKKVHTHDGVYEAKAVIVANGAHPRLIGCPGEKEFTGRGVSYCATCDASFFEDFEVYVVGGGDTAVEEAMYISKFARKVTIIHRRDELRATESIKERASKNEKIHFMWNSVVTKLDGDGLLSRMTVKDTQTGEERVVEADPEDGLFGVFVFIGFLPNSELYEGQLEMEDNYIIGDERMRTNLKGVYVAGDIRIKPFRQVVTATSDGAIAAMQVEHDLAAGELD
ncbi:MAG: thioredoxin-disulfide reductase [Saccharofermentanales bacterium]|jgi:thioredoxin reductase (NADPH)|nr:thioredoxin-disulfide reductase [Eubacteriales bacterium]MDD3611218.1 thioredoxin-disulfide reductase [Eubacteriales bacterium]NLW53922.1 thioredoxin-disulfide reductase [Clostridiaceae bacterium]HHU03982.1 thioredoxin-disulfide reductase [Fastidiosipila sp.]